MIVRKIELKREKSKIILLKMKYTIPMSKIKKITINTSIHDKKQYSSSQKTLSKLFFYTSKNSKLSNKIKTKSIAIANPNLTRYWNKQATFSV